jgi:hypothetical protein
MSIIPPLSVHRLINDKIPTSAPELVVGHPLHLDRQPQLPYVRGNGKEPPLPHQADVVPRRDEREQDAHRVATGQHVHEEKVELSMSGASGDEQGNGSVLRVFELLSWVGAQLPCVPVVKDKVLFRGKEGVVVFHSLLRIKIVEAFVDADPTQTFK